jgi:hypothetical protein
MQFAPTDGPLARLWSARRICAAVPRGRREWYTRDRPGELGPHRGATPRTLEERMDQDTIIRYITDTFAGVEVFRPTDGPGAGDTFFYYDPEGNLDMTRQLPFATIVTKDYGDFDKTSNLNRPDVFRLNIGVGRDTFRALFGYAPGEETTSTTYDFAALDRLMPHPVYAPQSYVCVLNPGAETFEAAKPLLAEAYSRAAARHASRPADRD